ncbi:MAG: hypothetical protein E7211_16805 [Clostridium lundense]|nr:hypothetical protein [Clostridium lundense]
MECRLILQTKLASDLNLVLSETVENNMFVNSEVCGVVYSDMEYDALIYFEEEIEDIKIYVNDTLRQCFYNDGKISFNAAEFLDKRIFLNYFGYVSITINIKTAKGNYEFYSKYLDVAVRDNISSELTRKMVSYITEYSSKYLFSNESNIKDFADIKKSKIKNINTEISILENILFEYESNFKYFKLGAKHKIDDNYVVDDFEKLKNINKETIQYILSNPQNLTTVNYNTGIVYNKLNLQPKKTLVNKNKISYNVYENQVVLGFLKHIYNSIIDKMHDVEKRSYNGQPYFIRRDYISSATEMYKEVNKILDKYKIKLNQIKEKFRLYYFMYKQVLKCEEIYINGIPKPSSIFMGTQHYRKIYKVIRDWFEGGNYNLQNEKLILTFSEASQIYEYYVLIRMSNYITGNGYFLKETNKFDYRLRKNAKYKNTRYENTFIFEKEESNITVYYQPVIYAEPVVYDNNIGLFRNNDISLDGERGQYYTPDYIIKVNKEGSSDFIILDAKFATIDSVIKHSFKRIVHNYVFSISTISNTDKINKVWVINGKEVHNQEEYIYNFYNSKFKDRNNELTPSMRMLTLNPNVDNDMQNELLEQLFSII